MDRPLSYFQRIIAYTLSYLIFLQQPLVIAAEMVSLEKAEHHMVTLNVPLVSVSGSSASSSSLQEQEKTVQYHIHRLHSEDKTLRIQLSPDIERLDGILALYAPNKKKPIACLEKNTTGFYLEVYEDYSLSLVGQDDVLPPLMITSSSPVSLEFEKLIHPLTIHASSIDFLKAMRVDGPVILWAKGKLGEKQAAELAPITLPTQTPSGKKGIVEAKGSVQTQGLKGHGSLYVFAGQFQNTSALLLNQLEIIANIDNSEGADLCGRDSVWLEGALENKGTIRTKGTLVEKGITFRHAKTSETFSAGSHTVQATNYRHNGTVYSAGTMRIDATEMAFGPQFHFMGNRFIAKGVRIDTSYAKAYFEALRYIELTSIDDFDNRARLRVYTFDFPYKHYFGDLTGLDEAQKAYYLKAIKELREKPQSITKENGEGLYGVSISSSRGTIFQAGQIDSASSDVTLQASYVGHDGITRTGNVASGSVKIVAHSASLVGIIEASKTVEAHVTGFLKMDLALQSPLTAVFANSLDISGSLRTVLIAKVSGAVRFLDYLKAQAIVVQSNALTMMSSPGSALFSQQIGSLVVEASSFSINTPAIIGQTTVNASQTHISADTQIHTLNAKADSFTNTKKLSLSGPSSIDAPHITNAGHVDVVQQLAVKVHNTSGLGSIAGPGQVDIDAQNCANPEALLSAETGIRPQTGISLTVPHAVTFERPHTFNHHVSLTAGEATIKDKQTAFAGMSVQTTNGNLNAQRAIFNAQGQRLDLIAQGGDLNLQQAQVYADIFYRKSDRNGYFGGGIFSAPQMLTEIDGLCDESTLIVDTVVNVPHYHHYDIHWGFGRMYGHFLTHYTTETQKQTIISPAQFYSHGRTRNGGKPCQIYDVRQFRGEGTKETYSYYDGSSHTAERIGKRLTHHVDGGMFILKAKRGIFMSRADIAALDDMISMTTDFGDVDTSNVLYNGAYAQQIAFRGKIKEGAEVLNDAYQGYQSGRTGGSGEYSYETTTSGQRQTAQGNVWNLGGGIRKRPDGTLIPTLLQQAGEGESITSQYVHRHIRDGLFVRSAPNGTIDDTTIAVTDTHHYHHQTRGKGFTNNWYSSSSNTSHLAGSIHARMEVLNTHTNNEYGLQRFIAEDFLRNAQFVHSRSSMNEFRSQSSMTSQRDGSDIFSQGGSSFYSENVYALSAIPMMQLIGGHYIETRPFPDQPGTRTLEGNVLFRANASTLSLDLVLRAVQEITEITSTLLVDNCDSFQRPQFPQPRFSSHNPTQMVRDINQVTGQVNEVLTFINNLRYGNYWSAALQVLGKFTNIESSSLEQYMKMRMTSEAAPFLDLGLTNFQKIVIEGVLAGMRTHSPTGSIGRLNVRAPRHDMTSESITIQETDSTNPVTVSVGHSESRVTQTQSARGSKPSSIQVSGKADLGIGEATVEGVELLTVVSVGDKSFTKITKKIQVGDQAKEVTFLREVGKDSGFVLVPQNKGKGVAIKKMSVIAAEYETRSDMEMTQSSWNVSLGGLIATVSSGGSAAAIMLAAMNSFSVSSTGQEKHRHDFGTQHISLDAQGTPVIIDTLHTKGNVTVRSSVKTGQHTHEDVLEVHTSSSSSYDEYKALNQFKDGMTFSSNIMGIVDNIDKLRKPVPSNTGPEYSGRDRVSLEHRMLGLSRDEGADSDPRDDTSGRGARRASGRSGVNPDGNPPRARSRSLFTESERSARSTIDSLNHTGSEADQARSFLDQASDQATDRSNSSTGTSSRSTRHQANRPPRLDLSDINPEVQNPVQTLGHFMDRVDVTRAVYQQGQNQPLFSVPQAPSSPTTLGNRIELNLAKANYEAVKDQGFFSAAKWKASLALREAQKIYVDRINHRQTQRAVTDAVNYTRENPAQVATYVAGGIATGAAVLITAPVSVTVGIGALGSGLMGLAANDCRVDNIQDVLNIGASAVTGGFVPIRVLSSLYGLRNVAAVSLLTGAGIGGIGYATGSTSMMVDGALLGLSGVFGAGKVLFTHIRHANTPNTFTLVANRNTPHPIAFHIQLPNTLLNEVALSQRVANQNLARLLEPARATGTGGPSFITRMSQGGRSDIPGRFSAGHAEGLGAGSGGSRAVPSSGGGTSGPSQTLFVRRIDKQQAHAERMARGEVNPLGQKLDFSRYSERTKGDAAHHIHVSHGQLRLDKKIQGVFYGEPTQVTREAWRIAQQNGIRPTKMGYEDVYIVHKPNAGYAGGINGQRTNLDYVSIHVQTGTNKLITAHPSGATPSFPKEYIPFSGMD